MASWFGSKWFRPKLEHPDPRVRMAAVEKISDRDALVNLVRNNPYEDVQVFALRQIGDPRTFRELIRVIPSARTCELIIAFVDDEVLLGDIAKTDPSPATAEAANRRVAGLRELNKEAGGLPNYQYPFSLLARSTRSADVAKVAVEQLADETLIWQVARYGEIDEARIAAARRLTSQPLLVKLALESVGHEVHGLAVSMLNDTSILQLRDTLRTPEFRMRLWNADQRATAQGEQKAQTEGAQQGSTSADPLPLPELLEIYDARRGSDAMVDNLLALHGPPRHLARALLALASPESSEPVQAAALAVLVALARRGYDDAEKLLIEGLHTRVEGLHTRGRTLHGQFRDAMRNLGTESAIAALVSELEDDSARATPSGAPSETFDPHRSNFKSRKQERIEANYASQVAASRRRTEKAMARAQAEKAEALARRRESFIHAVQVATVAESAEDAYTAFRDFCTSSDQLAISLDIPIGLDHSVLHRLIAETKHASLRWEVAVALASRKGSGMTSLADVLLPDVLERMSHHASGDVESEFQQACQVLECIAPGWHTSKSPKPRTDVFRTLGETLAGKDVERACLAFLVLQSHEPKWDANLSDRDRVVGGLTMLLRRCDQGNLPKQFFQVGEMLMRATAGGTLERQAFQEVLAQGLLRHQGWRTGGAVLANIAEQEQLVRIVRGAKSNSIRGSAAGSLVAEDVLTDVVESDPNPEVRGIALARLECLRRSNQEAVVDTSDAIKQLEYLAKTGHRKAMLTLLPILKHQHADALCLKCDVIAQIRGEVDAPEFRILSQAERLWKLEEEHKNEGREAAASQKLMQRAKLFMSTHQREFTAALPLTDVGMSAWVDIWVKSWDSRGPEYIEGLMYFEPEDYDHPSKGEWYRSPELDQLLARQGGARWDPFTEWWRSSDT